MPKALRHRARFNAAQRASEWSARPARCSSCSACTRPLAEDLADQRVPAGGIQQAAQALVRPEPVGQRYAEARLTALDDLRGEVPHGQRLDDPLVVQAPQLVGRRQGSGRSGPRADRGTGTRDSMLVAMLILSWRLRIETR
jgi:hypothetical protein